jgi:hypothetical protein
LKDVGEIFGEEADDRIRGVVNNIIAKNVERIAVIHKTRLPGDGG